MSLHDFTKRRQFRERETIASRVEPRTAEFSPCSPGGYSLAELESRIEHVRAKCFSAFIVGLMLGAVLGYWVLPGWVHHG